MGTDQHFAVASLRPPPQRRQQWPHWGCAPTSKEESLASTDPTSWDEEADLVLSAAEDAVLRPPSAQLKTAPSVLEAATTMGGSAVLCAGSFVAAGTKMQAMRNHR
ncbi:MAG: hypothetical protein ACLTEX_00750 [Eggerthella lenta]